MKLQHKFLSFALALLIAQGAWSLASGQGLLMLGIGTFGSASAATLQAIKYGMPFPVYPSDTTVTPNNGNCVLSAVDEECALVFSATEAKSIKTIHYYVNTVTTGCTLIIRVEGVGGTGDPDDNLWETDPDSSATHTIDGTDNTWRSVALTGDATVSKGSRVAITIKNPAADPCNMNIGTDSDTQPEGVPFQSRFNGTTWAKTAPVPQIVPQYSDSTFEPIHGVVSSTGATGSTALIATTYATDTAITEVGNEFTLPFSARVCGLWAWIDADGDFALQLKSADGSTTHATTGTHPAVVRQATTGNLFSLPTTATYDLTKNVQYRVMIVPTSTTDIIAWEFDIPDAAMMDMYPGGTTFYSSGKDAGGYDNDDTTRRAFVGLILCAFSDG